MACAMPSGSSNPGRLQAAAQTQHRFFVEDRHRIAAETLVYHEANRIRPKIDHGTPRQTGLGVKGMA